MINAQINVQGTVKFGDTNTPGVGVTVLEKGTNNAVVTDLDGKFKITVKSKKSVLVFSFIGFKTTEVALNGKTNISVTLPVNQQELSQVVVVGYGTQQKSDLTGAVSVVKMDNFDKREVSSVSQALQGQVAGVDVTSNSGTPGGGVMVRVRGIGTLNNSNPLYVVDGTMVDDIDFINPNDIASIQVLKDASATAIYGSRGANGVIIITTKNGTKSKQAHVIINSYFGVQNFWRKPPLCNAQQWAMLNNEAKRAAGLTPYPSLNNPDTLHSTDWFDQISHKNAPIQDYNVAVSGGSKKNSYFISTDYLAQQGIVNKTDFERISIRINSAHNVKKWLKVGQNFTLSKTKQHTVLEQDEWTNVLISALNIDPVTPVYNKDGSFAHSDYNDIYNPVAEIYYTNDEDNSYNALGNIYAQFNIFNKLKFKTNFSADYSNGKSQSYNPVYHVSGEQQNSVSQLSLDYYQELINQWTNTLTYENDFGNHHVTFLLGGETYKDYVTWHGLTVSNFPSDDPTIRYIDNANGRNNAIVNGSIEDTRLLSAFTRINYSYKDKYLLTINFRTDGSSKFTKGHRWGYFPSFSAGWKISDENFMKNIKFINFLKLRAGWGQIGNQESVAPYSFVTTASSGQNYVWGKHLVPGVAFLSAANTEIQWETSTTTNIGMDFGLFGNKITGTVEYFIKNTTNMLLQVPIPGQTGIQEAPWQNAGAMQNKGIEISLNYKNMKNVLKYSFGFVFSSIHNKVISLGNGNEFINGGSFRDNYYVNRTVVGRPIAQFYGYKAIGLFQNQAEIDAQTAQTNVAPGDVKYLDADKDGKLDMLFLGSPLPKFTGSFNINLRYKGFYLTSVFQGVYGNKIFNGTTYYNRSSSAYWNLYNDMLNRWTGEGSQNDPRYPRMNATDVNNSFMSNRYLEDGSYLRIKTFQIGYNIPKILLSKMYIQNAKIYFNAQNLYTFTKYTGLDPEIGQGDQGTLDIGIDRATYPQARIYSIGLSVTF